MDGLTHIEDYAGAHPREIGRIRIAQEEVSLAPAPLFAFGPIPDHLNISLFGGLKCNAVSCYILRNGMLGYDAVLFHSDTALWSPAFNHGDDFVRNVLARPSPSGQPVQLRHIKGSAACIHGPGYNVYGHWLIDILPRLSVLASAGYDISTLRYILPFDCPRVGLEFLHLMGIPPEHLLAYDPQTEIVQFEELIVPTNLRAGNRLHSTFSEATRAWVQRILPESPIAKPERRLFVSRENADSNRRLVNRTDIEEIAKRYGFDIVYPEKLPLVEQIALFRSARQVVGEYGSGLHGTIYGNSSLHCCALRGTSHWLGFIQSSLAHAFHQTASYVFGHAEPHAITYEFEVNAENFRRALGCLEVELSSTC